MARLKSIGSVCGLCDGEEKGGLTTISSVTRSSGNYLEMAVEFPPDVSLRRAKSSRT